MTHMITIMTDVPGSHVKTYQGLHFQYVQFITCKLYLNKASQNDSK